MLFSGTKRTTAVEEEIKKQKLVSPMPFKSPKLKWMAVGGIIVGFMAVLKYTGNLNKAFFIDWFKKYPTDVKQRPASGVVEAPKSGTPFNPPTQMK